MSAVSRGLPGGRGSLRLRLLAGTLVWVLLTVLVAGWALGRMFTEHVERQFQAELATHLNQLAANLAIDAGGQPALRAVLSDPRFARPYSGLYWQIDVLGFDQQFLSVLTLITSLLALAGMLMLRRFMARTPMCTLELLRLPNPPCTCPATATVLSAIHRLRCLRRW